MHQLLLDDKIAMQPFLIYFLVKQYIPLFWFDFTGEQITVIWDKKRAYFLLWRFTILIAAI